MTLILSGTNGLSDVDGSAATPAIRGTDTNTGIFFPAADTIGFAEGGTEVARFDSSGNFGIGTSSPLDRLDVVSATSNRSRIRSSGASEAVLLFQNSTTGTSTSDGLYLGIVGAADAYLWNYENNPLIFGTNNTERARITSTGNFGIGTTSPATLLHVNSASSPPTLRLESDSTSSALALDFFYTSGGSRGGLSVNFGAGEGRLYAGASGNTYFQSFYTNGSERARIDVNGTLLINTTARDSAAISSACKLQVDGSSGDYAAYFRNAGASPYGIYIRYASYSPNNGGFQFIYCDDASAQRFSVRSNGGVYNYQANDSNLSDRREKTNFAPAKAYLDTICAIPVQTFNYIDQSEDDPGLTLGVVAQDVQSVAPELVQESNWGTKDNPKMRLSVYQTDLQYALMKCIQELKAQNDELRQRVAALESGAK